MSDDKNKPLNDWIREQVRIQRRETEESLVIRPERGRPGWSAELFEIRWREAIKAGSLPDDAPAGSVVTYFRALDGTTGTISVGQLRKLHAKAIRGDLPRARPPGYQPPRLNERR